MKTYLVALDSSEISADVLSQVKEQAEKVGARLVLLRAVMRPLELPAEVFTMFPDKVEAMLVEAGRQQLLTLAKELPPELIVETVVQVGVPWQVICAAAKARDVDLIVVGAHGHRFLDRLLGTTAQRVVAHADRSVLVVWPAHPAAKPVTVAH